MSTTIAPEVRAWYVPRVRQGQHQVEYAYGTELDGTAWRRIIDRAVGDVRYDCLGYALESWDPDTREPRAGEDYEAAR
jgi:hypothetical protein